MNKPDDMTITVYDNFLGIFAYHASILATAKYNERFTLSPIGNLSVDVKTESVNNTVYFTLNGKQAGNYHGAVNMFAAMVKDYLSAE